MHALVGMPARVGMPRELRRLGRVALRARVISSQTGGNVATVHPVLPPSGTCAPGRAGAHVPCGGATMARVMPRRRVLLVGMPRELCRLGRVALRARVISSQMGGNAEHPDRAHAARPPHAWSNSAPAQQRERAAPTGTALAAGKPAGELVRARFDFGSSVTLEGAVARVVLLCELLGGDGGDAVLKEPARHHGACALER